MKRRSRVVIAALALTFATAVLFVSAGLDSHAQEPNRQLVQTGSPNQGASNRIALVIGNGAYTKAPPLKNPPNDARDMAATLRALGFDVTSGINANQRDMKRLIREFGQKLKTGGSGLFFYAGHGVQSSGRNYLIPGRTILTSDSPSNVFGRLRSEPCAALPPDVRKGSAFPGSDLFCSSGLRPKIGRSPKTFCVGCGRSETFRTSDGVATRQPVQSELKINHMKTIPRLLPLTLICLAATVCPAQKPTSQDEDASSRQIVLDRFNKARPGGEVTAGMGGAGSGPTKPRPPVYRRTGALRPPGARKPAVVSSEEIGVTVWRLRPSQSGDTGAQVLVLDGFKQSQWTPERIEADTPLNIGDRVRLTVESPRPGFLYIIDREQYADGSLGEPMLIFPTLQTRGGDNRVEPGRLIDIPAQEDQYSYFTAQPAGDRRDQVAEVLTIILVPQPLPLQIGRQPLKMTGQQITGWEKLWGGAAERLELVGGAGRPWTNEEKAAGAAKGRQLTQTGPPPQTVYRIPRKKGGPLLITVPLRYAR